MSIQVPLTTSKVRNIGNSIGVIIPKEVRAKLALSADDEILFTESATGEISISRVENSIEELSQQFIIDLIVWAKAVITSVNIVYVDDGVVYNLNNKQFAFFDNTTYMLLDNKETKRLLALYRAELANQ